MLWKILHLLFGIHYVSVLAETEESDLWVIRRVQFDGDLRPFVWALDQHIDLLTTDTPWFALTCPRSQLLDGAALRKRHDRIDTEADHESSWNKVTTWLGERF